MPPTYSLQQVDVGIALTEETLEHVYAAELWRVKGELLLGKARTATRRKTAIDSLADAAQQCFRRALKIARRQEARSLELRSAMSLVRLTTWRGGSRTARTLLRSLVASFTEGFDTKDPQDAQMLLGGPGSTIEPTKVAGEPRGRNAMARNRSVVSDA